MTDSPTLTRRSLLRSGAAAAGALAFGGAFYRSAFAAAPATPGPGPYGALGAADANGIMLPPGFRSREIARGGQVVRGTSYPWHIFNDGQAAFPTVDGGWILATNSETPNAAGGGASSITFDKDGKVIGARRILAGTSLNCAGGPTPWGTWLSGEEHGQGMVWECDPTGATPGVPRPAMGQFSHESVCVDPLAERLYLTEDVPDGCFYRFTPTDYPDLSAGVLEVATVFGPGNQVRWSRVPNPNPGLGTPTKDQVAGATRFNGGEGTWFDSGIVFFTTKGDKKVWAYDTILGTIEKIYDREVAGDGSALRAVDNVCVAHSGDIYICEDGDNLEICIITPDRQVAPFMRLDPEVHKGIEGQGNETVGVTFDPSQQRLYFGAQRSFNTGALYEISGPFRPDTGALPAGIKAGAGAAPALAPGGEGTLRTRDRVAPGVKLRHADSISATNLAKRGLAVTFEIDEPAGVTVRLVYPGGRTLAKRTTSVAVKGRVRLRIKPGKAASTAARRRRRALKTTLVIQLRDRAGNTRTVKRPVTVRASAAARRRAGGGGGRRRR